MPLGTNATTLQLVPEAQFITDPVAFNAQTRRNVAGKAQTGAFGGFGSQTPFQIPQVGVQSRLRVRFDGTAVVTTGDPGASSAFGVLDLLESVTLSANGQNNLWQCPGRELAKLAQVNNPYSGVIPGLSNSWPTAVTAGTAINATWEIPVAAVQASLIGALYAQSSATNIQLVLNVATAASLFTTPANITLTGTWSVELTMYEIPFDAQNRQILPDLSRLHGFNSVPTSVTNTGDLRVPLVRGSGQLLRLFFNITDGSGAAVGVDNGLERVRLNYGTNQTPYDFNPAGLLFEQMVEDYGTDISGVLFADKGLVIDFIRENPSRDVLYLQGVTELALILTLANTVTTGGTVTVTQETLF